MVNNVGEAGDQEKRLLLHFFYFQWQRMKECAGPRFQSCQCGHRGGPVRVCAVNTRLKSYEWSQSRERTVLNMYTWTWCVYKRCKPACILWPQNIDICLSVHALQYQSTWGARPADLCDPRDTAKTCRSRRGVQRSDHPGERTEPEDNFIVCSVSKSEN